MSTIEGFHCIQDTSPGPQGIHNGGVPLYTLLSSPHPQQGASSASDEGKASGTHLLSVFLGVKGDVPAVILGKLAGDTVGTTLMGK